MNIINIKKISYNTFWIIVERLFKSLFTLVVGAAVIQHLGPSQYGKIAYITAILAFFQALSSLGLDGILIREIINKQNNTSSKKVTEIEKEFILLGKVYYNSEVSDLITSALLLRFLFGSFLLFCFVAFVAVIENFDYQFMILAFLLGSVLIFQAADVIDFWNQSELNSKKTSIIKIFVYFLSGATRLYLIKLGAGIKWFAFASFIELSLIFILLIYFHLHKHGIFRRFFGIMHIAISITRETWPLIVSAVLATIYTRVDQLILKSNFGETELGIYNVATIFATATYFIPGAVCATMMPVITKAKKISEKEYLKKLKITYISLIIMSFFVFIFFSLMSGTIIRVFYGDEYMAGTSAMAIYAMCNIPVYIGVAHGIWMVNNNILQLSIYRALGGAIVSIVMGLVLIPKFGLIGAAISTVCASIVSDMIIPFAMSRRLFLNMMRTSG